MAETLPRWGLSPVEFIKTDPAKIKAEIITAYETVANRTLATADPIYKFLEAVANIIIILRNDVNIAAQQNLLSYAKGENLDAKGKDMQVDRLTASYAVTTLRFTLAQALGEPYIIPASFEVTNGVVTFATNEELIIPAGEMTGDVLAFCTTAGAVGNDYVAGQISTIVSPTTFLASGENITTTSGGADEEADPEYANRIRLAPNSYSVAGPEKAYEYHAYSVSSAIIDVKPYAPEENPGQVKIYLLLEGGELPSADVIDMVQAYFKTGQITPITDFVEVLAPTAKKYTINVDYWINKENIATADAIRTAVEEAVEEYRLWQQTKIARDITPDELISRVKNAGAARIDFSTLAPASWVELAEGEVAQCTSVNVSFKGYKDE